MNESDLLGQMRELLLGALRSREQEVFPYLGILVPALGGFGWLLYRTLSPTKDDHIEAGLFIAGTIGILLLLLLGAIYSLALGYNYRYITLELAKIENILAISRAMLRKWRKHPSAFLRYCYCHPPEMIKYFWLAFVGGILFVTLTACFLKPECAIRESVGVSGLLFALVSLLAPFFSVANSRGRLQVSFKRGTRTNGKRSLLRLSRMPFKRPCCPVSGSVFRVLYGRSDGMPECGAASGKGGFYGGADGR